jgi:hypothetical protein
MNEESRPVGRLPKSSAPQRHNHQQNTPQSEIDAVARLLAAFPGSTIVDCDPDDLAGHALSYASVGWEVFPLRGKVPAIPGAHPEGDPLRGRCKGECGRHGHGVLDATSEVMTVGAWWHRWPNANIGLRIPEQCFVLDVDPRNGGNERLRQLEAANGPLPATLTAWSGRGDGGRHLWFNHPGGHLSSTRLGAGLDIKTHAGYVVAPPSVHPETGGRYRWGIAHEFN